MNKRLVAWLQRHPHIVVSTTTDMMMGGTRMHCSAVMEQKVYTCSKVISNGEVLYFAGDVEDLFFLYLDDMAVDLENQRYEAVGASSEDSQKNPAAVALGKLEGRKGGLIRAGRLSEKRRQEIWKKAAEARWSKK